MPIKQELIQNLQNSSQPLLIIGSGIHDWEDISKKISDELNISKSDNLFFYPDGGVKDLREQINKFELKPHSSPFRLFSVYSADKLNLEQSNTLLKTLEEPPDYGRIILFSSTTSRIIATIKSRCQKFIFDHNIIHDRQSILDMVDNKSFSQFVLEIKNIEKDEIKDMLMGGLEEIKIKGLNDVNKHLYKKIAKGLIKLDSTNVNLKLILEDLYIYNRAIKEKL
ncbi:MAG: hypothetical protein NTZ65_00890 [Candidatus Berkelbacteria bacterium]|nr:hypothetical protein [Candidatus Berkelbacteria bacterium]